MICNQSNRAIDPYSAGNRLTDGGLIACPDCGKPVRLLPPLKGTTWGRLARHHEPKEASFDEDAAALDAYTMKAAGW